jgi:hypothetical protein
MAGFRDDGRVPRIGRAPAVVPKKQFAPDLPLEKGGFELSAPLARSCRSGGRSRCRFRGEQHRDLGAGGGVEAVLG